MAATINSFISALHTPNCAFNTLSDLRVDLLPSGEVAISRTKHFADSIVEWHSKRYILSLPLTTEGLNMAQRSAVKLHMLRSKILLDYRVLPAELNYVDARGSLCLGDLVLQELPAGELLSEAIEELEAQKVFEAIDKLESEFCRLSLALFNLKAENLIISSSYQLYPLRLHYACVGGSESDNFDSLREFVASKLKVSLPTQNRVATIQESTPNVQYGYKHVGNPFEGLCVAESHSGYGYIGTDGTEIIPPKFIWAGDMREGRAEVETTEGMGLIDAQGRYIIEPRYQIVEFDPKTGLSRVKENEKWATFDYEGRPIS